MPARRLFPAAHRIPPTPARSPPRCVKPRKRPGSMSAGCIRWSPWSGRSSRRRSATSVRCWPRRPIRRRWRSGALGSLLSCVGVLLGAIAGVLLAPHIVAHIAAPRAKLFAALFLILALVVVGEVAGVVLGRAVRGAIRSSTVRLIDSFIGV